MGPKKGPNPQQLEEDIEGIRESLDTMSEEIRTVAKQQATLLSLMDEIKQLKNLIKDRDKTINGLERRVEDLEQYSRMDDLIISGLETKHRTYARAISGGRDGDDASPEEQQTLEQQVILFFESKDITIESNNISACHTLPRRDSKAKPVIIVRFMNRKHKIELLRQGKKLKGTQVYLNEHLTKKNADIAREARKLKKQDKIQATWTRNCRVIIRLNGLPGENAKVITVRELNELDQYR